MSTAQSTTGANAAGEARTTPVPLAQRKQERTLGQLFSDASKDLSSILRSEVALAKVELKTEVTQGVKGAVFFVIAGVVAFFGAMMLLFAAAYGLFGLGLPRWVSFLIVAVVLFVVAGVAALVGKKQLSKVGPPERTVRTTKETVETLKAAKPHTA